MTGVPPAGIWSSRWLKRLEQSSEPYARRLGAARALMRRGNVVDFEVGPGAVHGRVVDTRGEVHRVDIAVRRLSHGERDDVAELIAQRAELLAALLDGEIPSRLVDEIGDLEVEIFPGPADLRADCSCDDWTEPCIHAAALCRVLAASFDTDPFTLFALRGMDRNELLDSIRSARAELVANHGTASARDGGEVHGARDVAPVGDTDAGPSPDTTTDPWDGWDARRDLGDAPLQGSSPGVAPDEGSGDKRGWALLGAPGTTPARTSAAPWIDPGRRAGRSRLDGSTNGGIDGSIDDVLDGVRRDASLRAEEMLSQGHESMLNQPRTADLARRMAGSDWIRHHLESTLAGSVSRSELDALAGAWTLGRSEAVAALSDETSWSTDQRALSDARDSLVDIGFEKRSVSLNYNSLGLGRSHTLVLSGSGHWYLLQAGGSRSARQVVMGPMVDLEELATVDRARFVP